MDISCELSTTSWDDVLQHSPAADPAASPAKNF
jgi:hypothetical protein